MAKVGASNAFFAPFKGEETPDAMPTYENGKKFGALMEATDNPNYTDGEMYGDDALEESLDEFTDADIELKACTLNQSDCELIFGIKADEEYGFAYPTESTVPFGGLCYVQTLLRNKKKFFRAFFFPKVKAKVVGDALVTRGKTVSFEGESLKFKAFRPLKEDLSWKYKKEFQTLPEAVTWIKSKLNITDAAAAQANGAEDTGENGADA